MLLCTAKETLFQQTIMNNILRTEMSSQLQLWHNQLQIITAIYRLTNFYA